MKGTPQFPQCGFSARAVEALSQIGRPFAYVNILENQDIRTTLPQIANWPTFPQLWINGELIGGSDIMLEMFQNGELKPLVEQYSPAPEALSCKTKANQMIGFLLPKLLFTKTNITEHSLHAQICLIDFHFRG